MAPEDPRGYGAHASLACGDVVVAGRRRVSHVVLLFCAARRQSSCVRNAGSINQRLTFDKYAQRHHIFFICFYRYDIISSAKPFSHVWPYFYKTCATLHTTRVPVVLQRRGLCRVARSRWSSLAFFSSRLRACLDPSCHTVGGGAGIRSCPAPIFCGEFGPSREANSCVSLQVGTRATRTPPCLIQPQRRRWRCSARRKPTDRALIAAKSASLGSEL